MSRYLEHQEQVTFFRLAAARRHNGGTLRDFLYAVPNAGTAGGRRAMLAGVRRKAEGVTAGVPDVECMLAMPPYTGWHCEMKRKNGKDSDVTEEQLKMIKRLRQCGRKCIIAFGADAAWEGLCEYLQIKV